MAIPFSSVLSDVRLSGPDDYDSYVFIDGSDYSKSFCDASEAERGYCPELFEDFISCYRIVLLGAVLNLCDFEHNVYNIVHVSYDNNSDGDEHEDAEIEIENMDENTNAGEKDVAGKDDLFAEVFMK